MARLTLAAAHAEVDRLTGGVFPSEDIDTTLVAGYRDFCRRTGVLFVRSTPAALQDVANTATYTLPSDVAQVQRVSYSGRTLSPLRSEHLVRVDAQALSVAGTVVGYVLDGDGVTKLRKFRVPSATDTTSKTAIEYTASAGTLDSTHAFQIPPWMVKYVIWYAVAALLKRNGVGQALKFSDHFQQRYDAGVKRTLSRKSKFLSRRTGVLGGGPTAKRTPIGPSFPWNYGQVVR